ncbi:MAG: hypothetical protein EHM33_18605 [Chloroflexi bacterium]|nr:MAG: hypothetical protein EHM33_18605 [Chloroflexota bacterium]
MLEIGPQLSINFRQEILTRFFNYVQSAESFYAVGGPGMGKTRLLDHLTKEDVQKNYLKENASDFRLIRVDLNRLFIKNEAWAFYELMLSSIVLELNKHETDTIRAELVDLDAKVIQSRDPMLALRFFELAANRLCQGLGLRLCFMLDEFDEAYKNFSHEMFSQLRAVRDANKNRISYVVFLRTLPERLRPTRGDNESFYELLSRTMLEIGPYSMVDTLQILQQLEVRRNCALTPARRERFAKASGGHIGLLQAFLSVLIENPEAAHQIDTEGESGIEWFGQQPASVEESRKIWVGLDQDERDTLCAFATGDQTRRSADATKLLFAKGLLQPSEHGTSFFSPVFGQYIRSQC